MEPTIPNVFKTDDSESIKAANDNNTLHISDSRDNISRLLGIDAEAGNLLTDQYKSLSKSFEDLQVS
jgi:hypothetical protein